MRRGFVRGIWGDCSPNGGEIVLENQMGKKAGKIYNDIVQIHNNKYSGEFVTYVFGIDNLLVLEPMGFKCCLIDESPIIWDMQTQLWRHKLDIFRAASEDFDEFIFLDWDCVPTAPLPTDFWYIMGKRAPLQANLMLYRTKRCLWREKEWRKTCNGGFVYMRGKQVVNAVLKNYEDLCSWQEELRKERYSKGKELRFREKMLTFDDEPSISKYVDDYSGGWPGSQAYWELFEPPFCNIKDKKSAFPQNILHEKPTCFFHSV